MNFITLHRAGTTRPGAQVLINVANIVAIEEMHHGTIITSTAAGSLLVHESVADIEALLNPMRAFTGKRDVAEAAEQDTRTKLLIKAYDLIDPCARTADLLAKIEKEVGEAAIEQYMQQNKGW